MGNQGVDQRTRGMARTGVDDEACRFVDHEQVAIFVDNGERQCLRCWFRQFRWRQREAHVAGGFTLWPLSRTISPSTVTCPSAIRRWKRARLMSVKLAASRRSSRSGAVACSVRREEGDWDMDENSQIAVETPPVNKFLLRLVIWLGVVLLLLFFALVGGIIYKSVQKRETQAAPLDAALALGLAADETIESAVLTGDRLTVKTGSNVYVIEVSTRRLSAQGARSAELSRLARPTGSRYRKATGLKLPSSIG